MAATIAETLAGAGLQRYEISNYARSGNESRHNRVYWEGGDYLGIGPGAHSYAAAEGNSTFGRRWREEKNPIRYMERVAREGAAAMEYENLDAAMAGAALIVMGRR